MRPSAPGLLACAALALAACAADYTLEPQGLADPPEPDLEIAPGRLVFADVQPGEEAVEGVLLRNAGDAALTVQSLGVVGGGGFSVLSAPPAAPLAPGEAAWVEVAFAPAAVGLASAYLSVQSDDPDQGIALVELAGAWGPPALAFDPPALDLGSRAVGCPARGSIRVGNVGAQTLHLDQLLLEGEGFTVDSPAPLALAAGEWAELAVRFTPPAAGAHAGLLRAVSDDPDAPDAPLAGVGDAAALCVAVDEGELAAGELTLEAAYTFADVAFLLDTTGSMGPLADAMAREFGAIAQALAAEIPNVTFGLATYEDYNYEGLGASGDLPFVLRQPQTADAAAVQAALAGIVIRNGRDRPESTIEAIYQAASGAGYDQGCDGAYDAETDVLPWISSAADAFGGAGGGWYAGGAERLGGMGFRPGILAVLVFATDAEARDPAAGYPGPGGCRRDATSDDALAALAGIGGRLIGVEVAEGLTPEAHDDLRASLGPLLARAGGTLATWTGDSAAFRETVAAAALDLVAAAAFDSVRLAVVSDPGGVVTAVSPAAYRDVSSGEEMAFTVTFSGALPAEPGEDASTTVTFQTIADDSIVLEQLTVEVVVRGR